MLVRHLSALTLALALLWYRSGRVLRANVLDIPPLPQGYFQGGDWQTHCSLVTDETQDELRYCEDITFWDYVDANGTQTDRHVLLGCDPNRKAWNTVMGPLRDPAPRGHLFLYPAWTGKPATSKPQKLKLVGYPPHHDFHPLGLEAAPSRGDGQPSNLFVVNHARDASTIEHFLLDPSRPDEARYVRTLRSRWLVAPNAIALTGPSSFYVSNDHLLTRRLPGPLGRVLPLLETVLGLPLGWVAHFTIDETTGSVLEHALSAPGIPFANGISLSPDGRTLAVASTSTAQLLFYTRDPSTNSLTHAHTVALPFLPDNIRYDDTGALLATGHPHFPSLAAVASSPSPSSSPPSDDATSPSWTVSLTHLPAMNLANPAAYAKRIYDSRAPLSASALVPAAPMAHDVETVFQSDGTSTNGIGMSSSSTALRDPMTHSVYVVGLYGEGMLICR
ncbi:calcium-dependent phosphotriesterase [Coniophora puteana RWD-64-598 SS2]|uniref:Calcium-dependent phosphotriesterase n=1 Tax=Coniophora puteana (strain RWD-64-598) TaxID=741705 RepID=A0A5M3MXJ6_CONPW|nr:calcium-dependent phosphotriesterase [Coniophora puteana RWD-64-598 SS2]EIW83883.1 calcium-dependent phosphotriesterase [Coniophora puteana RWD-64-598 SS2]